MSKKIKIFIALVLIALVGGVAAWVAYDDLLHPNVRKTVHVNVYPDDDLEAIINSIEATKGIKDIQSLRTAAKWLKLEEEAVAGHYEIKEGENNLRIIHKITRGQQTPVRISFTKVRTKSELAEKLTDKLLITSDDFLNVLNQPDTYRKYGLTSENVISLFIPNTYEVYWTITATDLIERMKKEYDRFWNDERRAKLAQCDLTQTDVVTLASIVNEETNKNDEKAMVAGLYLNRLRIGMPLQADPTVKFALQNFSLRRIYSGHLKYDSPYNTYMYPGLPPGPICTPSSVDIDAVLNYAHHNYIYMCAKEDFSQYHNFAATYAEHQANAQKYKRQLNRRGIK